MAQGSELNLDTETRIAVIGAGPGGLSAALTLHRLGYRRVTVLEREYVVGGKCHTFWHQGKPYDLGANLTTSRYVELRRLAEEVGLGSRPIPTRRIVDVETGQVVNTRVNLLKRLALRAGSAAFLWFRGTEIDKPGYVRLSDALDRPFRSWLARRGLGFMDELFQVLFTAYGYGHVMDLPAVYALKFFDMVHTEAAIGTVLGTGVPDTTDFPEGFQELWERVDEHFHLGTKRGAVIQRVERPVGGPVRIHYGQGGTTRVEEFDKLIIACNPRDTLKFLDTTSTELYLFSQLDTFEYYVTVVKASDLPPVSTYLYPWARKITPGQPTVFYAPGGNADGVFVFYAYGGPDVTEHDVHQNIATAVKQLGGTLESILHTKKWNYFPHIDAEAMGYNFYDDLECIQGENSTFYVGEAIAFTLTELIMRHARDLVERRFSALPTRQA